MADLLERFVAALEALEQQTKSEKEQSPMRRKAVASVNTSTLLTQPGGLFSIAGIENEVISTHIAPMGLGAALPAFPSNIDDPRYGFLTGFTTTVGSEATAPCGDAPMGFMKAGNLTATFGRIMRQTQTIEIDKVLHQKRGASTELRLLGEITGQNIGGNMSNVNQQNILNTVVDAEMIGVGVQLERKLATLVWQGAISNNTAQGGYKEFPGLDNQIATGQKDADTGTLMPSADSDIKNFNYNDVDGTTLDIVEYLSMLEYFLYYKAQRTGMLPVTWAVVMRPELWFELSAVWPCRYLTDRCRNSGGTNPVVINDSNNVDLRDRMRDGMSITINGRTYPVIVDDGIYENTNATSASVPAGYYASNIYMVPLRVRGSFPVTYWEYIDYRGVQAQIAGLGQGAQQVPFWTDDGRFLWVYRPNGYCFDLQAKIEPRIVLRTPHLAGKIQNVRYSPLQHLVDSNPSSSYHVNGGVSLRGGSTNQAVWGNFVA